MEKPILWCCARHHGEPCPNAAECPGCINDCNQDEPVFFGTFAEAVAMLDFFQAEQAEEVPPCAASMGCLCAGHARDAAATEPCDTTE